MRQVARQMDEGFPQVVHREGVTPDGVERVVIDGAALADKHSLLSAIAEALDLPDYFGLNWDALEEALRDWFDSATSSRAVEISRSGEFERRSPEVAATLQAIWADVGREFAGKPHALHLVMA